MRGYEGEGTKADRNECGVHVVVCIFVSLSRDIKHNEKVWCGLDAASARVEVFSKLGLITLAQGYFFG